MNRVKIMSNFKADFCFWITSVPRCLAYSAPISRRIVDEADAQMRLAPASSTAFTSARVRKEPEAHTPQRPPATPRIKATSAGVAPWEPNPVEVLMKSAPDWMAISAQRSFSSMLSREVSRITLSSRAVMVSHAGSRVNCVLDCVMVATFELAERNHHFEFSRA